MFFLRDAYGQESGPFPADTVRGWIESGECSLFIEARRDDQVRWRLLGAFTEFARAVPGVALAESRRSRSDFERIGEKAVAERRPPPPPMPEEEKSERVGDKAPPPVAKANVRWQRPSPSATGSLGQSRKNVRTASEVPLEAIAEGELPRFELPKWAWSVWLICVAVWTLTAIGNGQFSFWELAFKIFLLPWGIAYFSWGKLGHNNNYAAVVFLGLSLFLQFASCAV